MVVHSMLLVPNGMEHFTTCSNHTAQNFNGKRINEWALPIAMQTEWETFVVHANILQKHKGWFNQPLVTSVAIQDSYAIHYYVTSIWEAFRGHAKCQ